ncbi:unnamed protein product [Penicillium nalgiovense]|uniref:F-box domain-containing protein n=2 Tax=Penicillium nalgiovense TaxID=60175 RepID=A0A9W4MQI6_PENNA|nr:unnamed protein product [Penicillium nalgiovense]CAG8015541.1 unnamed protein product [Penicillium nalgiovense]CAG8029257.1 unnamed protein product [Penicillium nalgiovense]CAG8048087.1 unnamed protein product [Penicillium nalgiovense]CAG8052204.1 unnamed protein product [Penicillium nalgiovense]
MQSLSAFFSSLNTFPGLPVELLLSIADFLSRDDVTCISLCNRQLFAIFQLRSDPIPLIGRGKLPFLTRLGRDLPSFFICYQCNVLHRYYASKDFLPGPLFQASLICLSKSLEFSLSSDHPWTHNVSRDSKIVFDFLHLQLAMRRFYYGPEYGISTEDISYTQVRLYTPQSGTQIPLLSSLDAQICSTSPSLILRVQQIMSVPRRKRYLLYRCPRSSAKRSRSPPYNMSICNHEYLHSFDYLLNGVVGAHRAGEKAPSVSFACDRCDTEVLVEISECENELALVITKWINLGAGLTPDDPPWKKHHDFGRATMIHRSPDKRGKGKASAVTASARTCFESASVDSLRARNIAYLKDQRFKKTMFYQPDMVHGPTWYLYNKHR